MGRAYRFVLEHTLARGIRPLMLNSWHAFNQYSLAWEYYSAQGGAAVVDTFELAAAAFAPEPTPANLDRLLQTLAAEGVGALVSIDGSPAGSFTSWQTVDALQKRGEAELVASSDSYAFVAWSDQYRARVFAGSFRNQAEFDAARLSGRGEFQIRLHVYRVLWDDLGGRSDEVPVTRSEVANTWP
jgi:hypothetical protein